MTYNFLNEEDKKFHYKQKHRDACITYNLKNKERAKMIYDSKPKPINIERINKNIYKLELMRFMFCKNLFS